MSRAEEARPRADPERSVLPIAGDDPGAKAEATALLDALGYDAYDVGALAEGWRFQRDLPACAALFAVDGDFAHPRRVTVELLAQKLAEAKRYRDL